MVLTQCPAWETQCPAYLTWCVIAQTQCPAAATVCPPFDTVCPAVQTLCPRADTVCPAADTACPGARTECPPAATACPAVYTRCPETRTNCPALATECGGDPTRCPAIETRCPMIETRCPPEVKTTFSTVDVEGFPAAEARVVAWQPGLRSATGTTDDDGETLLGGLVEGYEALVYAISADGDQAAFAIIAPGELKMGQPVELYLVPARTGTIVLVDRLGNALSGAVTVYLSTGERPAPGRVRQTGRDAIALFNVQVAADAQPREAKADGLLPGVRYLVRAWVKGYRPAVDNPWIEWSFRKDDAQPKLIIRFEREE
jgi:hypothetical protein